MEAGFGTACLGVMLVPCLTMPQHGAHRSERNGAGKGDSHATKGHAMPRASTTGPVVTFGDNCIVFPTSLTAYETLTKVESVPIDLDAPPRVTLDETK